MIPHGILWRWAICILLVFTPYMTQFTHSTGDVHLDLITARQEVNAQIKVQGPYPSWFMDRFVILFQTDRVW